MLAGGEGEPVRARRVLEDFTSRLGGFDLRDELDAAAVELLAAFDAAGARALLLKGPVLARVLYEPGEQRMYNDVDILVEPGALERARAVMRARGCMRVQEFMGVEDVGGGLHAENWVVGAVTLDLHGRLPASSAPPDVTWNALYATHQLIDLGGHRVAAPGRVGLALHIAVHAAQHGGKYAPVVQDLKLALERWPSDVWARALAVAREIGATQAFAAGLQLAPAGREMARILALPESSQLNWTPVDEWPRGTYHLRAFAKADSLAVRARVLRRALLPPSRWILWEYPWAKRSRALRLAAYAMHLTRAPLWGSRALRFHRRRGRSAG